MILEVLKFLFVLSSCSCSRGLHDPQDSHGSPVTFKDCEVLIIVWVLELLKVLEIRAVFENLQVLIIRVQKGLYFLIVLDLVEEFWDREVSNRISSESWC